MRKGDDFGCSKERFHYYAPRAGTQRFMLGQLCMNRKAGWQKTPKPSGSSPPMPQANDELNMCKVEQCHLSLIILIVPSLDGTI